ncbi:DUF2493 domain-containing protein [Streptomyces sp. NPDC056230]|uniref:DUF2493 domain-containing protein n=1 Tax=Streptomyces sp. NPDC056230 TaxID=3345754 RepID=UPI0035DDCB9B
MRILVTGSRDWDNEEAVHRAIFRELYIMKCPHGEAALIHGACPTGADAMASAYAHQSGMHVISHPANWERDGKSAGFRRNAEMVNEGADICLAFIKNGSRGASMTANLAEKAGIHTVRYIT